MEKRDEIEISLSFPNDDQVNLIISSERAEKPTIYKLSHEEAEAFGESCYQLTEGCFYEYVLDNSLYEIAVDDTNRQLILQSRQNPSRGRIIPNTYVGSLTIRVRPQLSPECARVVKLEVQSYKTNYRDEYRQMMANITEYCTELVLQHHSPVSQRLVSDYAQDPQTLYQRFAFVKSMIDSPEFDEAIHRILSAPVTQWELQSETFDARQVKKINATTLRQIASAKNRIKISPESALAKYIPSVPRHLHIQQHITSVDTAENRFIKYALGEFQQFAQSVAQKVESGTRTNQEAQATAQQLESILSHSIFKEVSSLSHISINSPILQRKEGYREILRLWHMFDLAAKLIWQGGDDVYEAGKRDVATLYEYWLFFQLLEAFKEIFTIEPTSLKHLLQVSKSQLALTLKSGTHIPIHGIYQQDGRSFHVQFSYNRTFSETSYYPQGGSWTRRMRPDYTLSIWPAEFTAQQAEEQELIVHLHFDAKYKVDLQGAFEQAIDLDEEKKQQKQGNYKRADLLKMHAYRDAIRRTAGAYILYPGEKSYQKVGYHELLPGLGAFNIRPAHHNSGMAAFKTFIREVLDHFVNRASQRERLAYSIAQIFEDPQSKTYHGWLPSISTGGRSKPPEEINVLIGYYHDETHLTWTKQAGLYNLRLKGRGSKEALNPRIFGASFLLLHCPGHSITDQLFEITQQGPSIYSKKQLKIAGYPTDPSQEQYLVFKVKVVDNLPTNQQLSWDVRKMAGYKSGRGAGFPFAVSLLELMDTLI